MLGSNRRVFGVAQILNKQGGGVFDGADERRFTQLVGSMGIILESWWQMSIRYCWPGFVSALLLSEALRLLRKRGTLMRQCRLSAICCRTF